MSARPSVNTDLQGRAMIDANASAKNTPQPPPEVLTLGLCHQHRFLPSAVKFSFKFEFDLTDMPAER
jgi:hypothetical protein